MRAKYPRKALVDVRQQQSDAAAAEFARATAARGRAEMALQAKTIDRQKHAVSTLTAQQCEDVRLAQGRIRIADLAMAEACEQRTTAEASALTQACEASLAECMSQRAEEIATRGLLALKQADLKVIEQDESKWRAAQEQAALVVEEEDALEAFTGRRRI